MTCRLANSSGCSCKFCDILDTNDNHYTDIPFYATRQAAAQIAGLFNDVQRADNQQPPVYSPEVADTFLLRICAMFSHGAKTLSETMIKRIQ